MLGHWLMLSLIAVLFLTPIWLAMPFFDKNYGVPASVFAVWYFLGTATSTAAFGIPERSSLVPSVPLVAAIFLIGFFGGSIANNSLFVAVVKAPNPGLPVAVSTLAGLTTFLAAIALGRYLPTHFPAVEGDIKSLIGVVLLIVGTALVAVR